MPDLVQRPGTLRDAGSFLAFCCLILLPPVLPLSCRKPDPPEIIEEEPPEAVPDSADFTVRWHPAGTPVRLLDLFVYGSEGTRALERHVRLDSLPAELTLRALPGEKILVGIANSPHRFNRKALERYDAMEQLTFKFTDDDPGCPILGGFCTTDNHDGEIHLQPLLCRVVLTKVCNTMDGYDLLEDPHVRLRDLPDAAEILRKEEFRPTELLDADKWVLLPCDVGYFPQEPGLVLWCYPNDTPEDVLGVPRPALEFECSIRGQMCSFEVPLPPLPRGCSKSVEITIEGPGSFRYNIQ